MLESGSELLYTPAAAYAAAEHSLVTLGGTNWVLLEFVPDVAAAEVETALRQITGSGYRVLLAHIERYPRLARSGAHPDFDGRSPGHVQHPEGPVADARRRIDRHGRRGRLPIDLPRAVGHHADGIVGGVGFVEGERFGFDGGIGVVRRVVTAAGGEKQQTAQKNPHNPRGGVIQPIAKKGVELFHRLAFN